MSIRVSLSGGRRVFRLLDGGDELAQGLEDLLAEGAQLHLAEGDREVLAAIIFVANTGCTWAQLPPVIGPSGLTVHHRFIEWSQARVWAKLYHLITDRGGSPFSVSVSSENLYDSQALQPLAQGIAPVRSHRVVLGSASHPSSTVAESSRV
ncbi:transposase [Nocardiopsis arvandica]|uniref:Transposase n=1 Tax=Nocardiopsis sinuspersici TaxID=501010 RepID=A0A7Z0BI14_9ACTN|nr:transposase [Nocardiopsis sinuspersici]